MYLAHRWMSRDLSRLELVVALVILLIIASVFMGLALRVFAAAEERYVDATVLNINTALRIRLYRYMVEGRLPEVITWRGANPVVLIEEWGTTADIDVALRHPALARYGAVAAGLGARYAGEFDGPDPAGVERGQWYFDRADGALVYRVRNMEFFRSPLHGPARIRYGVNVRFDDLDGDGEYNPGTEVINDVTLAALEAFQWIEAGSER